MKIALVTTRSAAFFGVFARNYRSNQGPPISNIIFLPDKGLSKKNLLKHLYLLIKLSGFRGISTLIKRKFTPKLLPNGLLEEGFSLNMKESINILSNHQCSVTDCKNKTQLADTLKLTKPDILISVGAPIIFNRKILNIPRKFSINIHNGKIPMYRGHFSTFWEIYNQEENAFVSIHEMSNLVDSGRIFSLVSTPISKEKNLLDLIIEKKRLGGKSLASLLRKQEFESIPSGQTPGKHCNFPTIPDIYRCPKIKQLKHND